jgi:hypothetical protein
MYRMLTFSTELVVAAGHGWCETIPRLVQCKSSISRDLYLKSERTQK